MNPNLNLFLQLPIYERVALLENIENHGTFATLVNMEEFGFLKNNPKLEDRIYKARIDKYFPHLLSFIEEGMTWRQFYERLVQLEKNIANIKTPNDVYILAWEYIKKRKSMEFFILYSLYPNIPKFSSFASLGLINNNIAVLEFMNSHSIQPSYNALLEATKLGNIEGLKWMSENTDIPFDSDIADVAAENNQLEILQWLYTLGVYPSKYALMHAAGFNYIDVLKWAVSKFKVAPFTNTISFRRQIDDEMYNFLIEQDLLLPTVDELNDLVKERNLSELISIYTEHNILPDEHGANIAQQHGYTEILAWLSNKGIQPSPYNHLMYLNDDEEDIY